MAKVTSELDELVQGVQDRVGEFTDDQIFGMLAELNMERNRRHGEAEQYQHTAATTGEHPSQKVEPTMVKVTIVVGTGSGGRRGWVKHIKSVDPSKKGGYCFDGDFLDDGQNELPEGAVVLDVWPTGSAKNGDKNALVSVVGATGLRAAHEPAKDYKREFVDLRKLVEQALAGNV